MALGTTKAKSSKIIYWSLSPKGGKTSGLVITTMNKRDIENIGPVIAEQKMFRDVDWVHATFRSFVVKLSLHGPLETNLSAIRAYFWRAT